jgi:hypothetical protein
MSARLYFDLVNTHESLPDREGIEIVDVSLAKAAIVEMVDELRQEDASTAQEWSGWTLNVSDDAGRVLFSIDLDSRVQVMEPGWAA